MKRWCIIDDMINARGLENLTVFESKEQALENAEREWNLLDKQDKLDRNRYIVGLCNVEKDESGCWNYAEDHEGNIDADIYEVAKDFKEIKYWTRDRETGNKIESFETLEEARAAILAYEEQDKADDTYSEDFYEIYNEENEEIVEQINVDKEKTPLNRRIIPSRNR